MRFAAILLLVLAVDATVAAQPIVRAEITPAQVSVGESAELKITVLVPTWFTRPSIYPSFELVNAITRLPDDSSFSMRERVGNDSWSGIVRSYEILPLLGAKYTLSGQSISISYANPGSDPLVVDVEVPEVTFQSAVPPGAAALDPYLAGRSLKIDLSIDGETADLEVGDALVLEYAVELDGLPAIFLPPLAPAMAWDGVAVYADSPVVSDAGTARRSEKISLVFDAGGEFVIPGLALRFWNTETASIDSASAQGFSFSVAGPVVPPPATETGARLTFISGSITISALVLLAYLFYRLSPIIARSWRESRERRHQSESYAFTQMQAAMRSDDAVHAYRAMLMWMERLDPQLSVRQLAEHFGDESMPHSVDAFIKSVYADAGSASEPGNLANAILSARRRYLRQSKATVDSILPPLNP